MATASEDAVRLTIESLPTRHRWPTSASLKRSRQTPLLVHLTDAIPCSACSRRTGDRTPRTILHHPPLHHTPQVRRHSRTTYGTDIVIRHTRRRTKLRSTAARIKTWWQTERRTLPRHVHSRRRHRTSGYTTTRRCATHSWRYASRRGTHCSLSKCCQSATLIILVATTSILTQLFQLTFSACLTSSLNTSKSIQPA